MDRPPFWLFGHAVRSRRRAIFAPAAARRHAGTPEAGPTRRPYAPPDTGGTTATSSPSPIGVASWAWSPFTQTAAPARTRSKSGPNRRTASSQSARTLPASIVTRPHPAAVRAGPNRRRVAISACSRAAHEARAQGGVRDDHLHQAAFVDALSVGEHGEPVGERHRADLVAPLARAGARLEDGCARTGGAEARGAFLVTRALRELHPDEVRPAVGPAAQRLGGAGHHPGTAGGAVARHRPKGWPHQQLEAHRRGDRVAREPEDRDRTRRALQHREGERLRRPDGDLHPVGG